MVIARWAGLTLLATAALIAGSDGYQSYRPDTSLLTTNVRDLWTWTQFPYPPSVFLIPSSVPWPFGDRSLTDVLLDTPVALALGVVGVGFWLIGQRKHAAFPPESLGPIDQVNPEAARLSPQTGSELRKALWSSSGAFLGVAAFSAIINVLMLTGAIFMLVVYDRVLPSGSVSTLVGFCIIAGILFTALAALDMIRSRLLVRAGGAIDEALSTRVFEVAVRRPVRVGTRGDGLTPFQDIEVIRFFLSGPGPTALFDLPWLPFYLAIVYAFHPMLGMTALAGAVLLIGLTLLTEVLSRRPTRDTAAYSIHRNGLAGACLRNAEVLAGMGFAPRLAKLWRMANDRTLISQRRTSDIAGGLGAIARAMRMVLQSSVLAVGAYLVIVHQASAGIIIAGAILAARALAPVDIAIANWRAFIAARQSWSRLGTLLDMVPSRPTPMPLPPPSEKLQVENIVVVPPGDRRVVVRDVSLVLNRGQGLGIIGPSGSGKSSLARSLVGAWVPVAGNVRLDGAALTQWAPEVLGQHLGYLPQDVELFAGTIAQNISRFAPEADPETVIKAARQADVHQLIVGLPGDKGYESQIGEEGAVLSAGQRQRVALARALYGDPFLVVLDEPDASLDQDGEEALAKAIRGVQARGGIVIVISHRQTVLGAVDLLMAMDQGRPLAAGPKALVLQRMARPAAGAVQAMR